MAITKALVLHQPYATAAVIGLKGWETRGQPFAGEMCPPGVRALPGCRVERGERIAIVAGKKAPPEFAVLGDRRVEPDGPDGYWLARYDGDPERGGTWLHSELLHLGAVVGTVRVVDALPMVDALDHERRRDGSPVVPPTCVAVRPGALALFGDGDDWPTDISGQLPWGDWRPGRWAMELADPVACDPIPVTGRQVVFRLPDEVAERVTGGEG